VNNAASTAPKPSACCWNPLRIHSLIVGIIGRHLDITSEGERHQVIDSHFYAV
jgi:hypothetical protein